MGRGVQTVGEPEFLARLPRNEGRDRHNDLPPSVFYRIGATAAQEHRCALGGKAVGQRQADPA